MILWEVRTYSKYLPFMACYTQKAYLRYHEAEIHGQGELVPSPGTTHSGSGDTSRGDSMELRTLTYFLAVAQEQNISKAASSLHLTQPTLSRQMSELEESIGIRLFHRGSRQITLTEEGLLLRRRAQEILSLVQKTTAELKSPEEAIEGVVHIGGGETDGMRLIASATKQLQQKHPHVGLHLFSGNADDVMDRLDNGLLDFGLLIDPADITRYEFLPLPVMDTWGALLRKDDPLAAETEIHPSMINERPLIHSIQTQVSSELSRWFGEDFEHLHVAATYNLVFNASLLVEAGLGIALCLDKLVDTSELSALCFRPLSPTLHAHMNLVWKKQPVFSRAADAFLHEVRHVFASDEQKTSRRLP